jgi:hypothetical protein
MVNALFPEAERADVLAVLEKSVVFLTADTIEEILRNTTLRTTWTLANLYLSSIGGEVFCDRTAIVVGLSEGTPCYVSHEYFLHTDRFADFVVHEAAHVFHNCKRVTVGLPETRAKEFLLNIDFCQRETFAYACEVYSRILELADSRQERMILLEEARSDFIPPDDRVDLEKFREALSVAASARNGWKKILQVCAPAKRATTSADGQPKSAYE